MQTEQLMLEITMKSSIYISDNRSWNSMQLDHMVYEQLCLRLHCIRVSTKATKYAYQSYKT